MKLIFCAGLAMLSATLFCKTNIPTDPPEEFGAVTWNRDLEAAKKQSAETGKPVLVLFQEVPG